MEDSINTYYFWMNTEKAPFNDIKVRQAINYAVDPEALNRIFGGRLHPTQQILPPGMPGYQEYKLYPGPDMDKAKQLIAEANPADKDITVWTDDEPDRKRIGEYYHDLLTQLGFNATLKVIAGDVYLTTIGNQSTPDLDTGFADWFQDFPHPDDFFRPLLHGDSILPTNGNNYSRVNIPANNAKHGRAADEADRRRRRRGAVRRARQGVHGAGGLGAVRQRAVHDVRVRAHGLRQVLSPSAVQPGLHVVRDQVADDGRPRSAQLEAPRRTATPDRCPRRADPGPQPLVSGVAAAAAQQGCAGVRRLFVLIVLFCLAAPLWADHVAHTGPNENHITEKMMIDGQETDVVAPDGTPLGPGLHGKFLLGADQNGRDVMVRLMYGGRTSLYIGLAAAR